MDRWNIVTTLNYLALEKEMEIILAKNKSYNNSKGKDKIANMINLKYPPKKIQNYKHNENHATILKT